MVLRTWSMPPWGRATRGSPRAWCMLESVHCPPRASPPITAVKGLLRLHHCASTGETTPKRPLRTHSSGRHVRNSPSPHNTGSTLPPGSKTIPAAACESQTLNMDSTSARGRELSVSPCVTPVWSVHRCVRSGLSEGRQCDQNSEKILCDLVSTRTAANSIISRGQITSMPSSAGRVSLKPMINQNIGKIGAGGGISTMN
mmetsp:Transcript_5310/g.11175  ORF Transcript_5310/g.11175 Transcript_5310/m.11175 type:complete len:200 (-) Transcript_5310:224-823(-)